MQRNLRTPSEGNCVSCGSQFTGQRNKRFCSQACAKREHQRRVRRERVEREGPKSRGDSAGICLECSTPFIGQSNRRFCSRRCSKRYYDRTHADDRREARRLYCARYPDRIREYTRRRWSSKKHELGAIRRLPSERQKRREYERDYRARHAERLNARDRRYRLAHVDAARRRSREWRLRNPERHAHIAAARRARVMFAQGSHTFKEWQELLVAYAHRCAYCGHSGVMTKDHRIPLIRGGGNSIENILPACPPCNQRKGGLTEDEFRARWSIVAR